MLAVIRMRKTITFIVLYLSSIICGFSQTSFKVINALTKQPIKDQYCNIIKDGDTFITIGNTDNKGIYKPELLFPDSNASYQLWISANGFKPYKKNIDLFSKKLAVIAIYPDKESIKRSAKFVYSDCSSIGFGDYEPKTPQSLNELPDSIREKLDKHLVGRLGEQFYSKLKLNGGQIVNLDRLYKVNLNAKDYKWTPYSYYLCLSFQDTTKGIGLYTAKIVLDKNGNVVKEIELPDIVAHPEKANLISINSAKVIAKSNSFPSTVGNIKLQYDNDSGSLVWCFEKITKDNGLSFSTETLIIDAHTGKVLGSEQGHGIR
jgi:hypothetical protein